MKLRAYLICLFVAALFPWPSGVVAAIEASYRQARSLIGQSLEQANTSAWLRQQGPILVESHGTLNLPAGHLGNPSDSFSTAPYRETWAWDPESGVLGREYRLTHPDGHDEWIREIFPNPFERWRIDLGTGDAHHFSGPEQTARRDRILRRFTPLLLSEALDHAAALRFTGRFGPFDSVQMQTDENESLSLFFGRESRHLGWVEYLTDLPTFGDSTVSWKFSDYRSVDGIGILPHGVSVHVNEALYLNLEVQTIRQSKQDVEAFLALDNLPRPERAIHPRPRIEHFGTAHRIADVTPGTHLLAVEFEDYLLVVDAPAARPLLNELPASSVSHDLGPSALSKKALEMLREAIPGKPVRYLLLSHFHSDSAGGLMAFSHAGVELITSAEQATQIDKLLEHSHTLQGVETEAGNFRIHPVEDGHVIEDNLQRVEILKVGPNPHSQDMLVAWLPRSGILWVADLQRGVAGRPDARQMRLNHFFQRWLSQQAIEPELILTAHGDGVIRALNSFRVDAEQTHNLPRDP